MDFSTFARSRWLATVLLLLVGSPLLAADLLDNADLAELAAPARGGNAAQVIQHGSDHEAFILQQGDEQLALIRQYGQGNRADISQTGSDNQAAIVQYGSHGSAGIEQTGHGLRGAIIQRSVGQHIQLIQQR